jgi:serine/threonine protein kinase
MIKWEQGQELLGEYLIEKEIGQSGGMGRVWLVKSKSTGRRFAVKQTKHKDEKSQKAFLAELQTWIDLPEHPNIVPCRFFRTVGDEIVIFTDYVEGGSLKDWIDQGKLTTLGQILDVAIQFAWGLHAIHERGLIHQDVKPGNVLMTADGVPMVADFGLARARQVAPCSTDDSPPHIQKQHSILVPGAGLMTKEYASPEQRAGKPLSRKTDIWSWGVSVLDMFMDGVSCPHGGHIAADVLEAFMANGGQDEGLPKMAAEMADILRKCFAREPAQRWTSLDAAVEAAKGLFHRSMGRAYMKQSLQCDNGLGKIVQHDRQGIFGVKWHDPRKWLQIAYACNKHDPAEAYAYQVPSAFSRKGAAVAHLAILEEAERQFKAAMFKWNSAIAEELAGMLFDKAMVYQNLDDAQGSCEAAGKSIAIYRRLVEQEGQQQLADNLAKALMNKANALVAMDDKLGAEALFDEGIAILRRMVEIEGRRELANDLAKALMSKANILSETGDMAGAVKLFDLSINMLRRLVEQEERRDLENILAMAVMNKARVLEDMGDLAGSIMLSDECIAIWRRLVEREGRRGMACHLAMALMNKANTLSGTGNLAGAVNLYDECIKNYRLLVEQEGRRELANDLAKALMNKANALGQMGGPAVAAVLHGECIDIYRQLVEQEGRRELAKYLALALMNKAIMLSVLGEMSSAVKLLDECIMIRRQLVEKDGHQELLGDLAWVVLVRATVINKIGTLSEVERRQSREAYRALAIEAQRTGRADLKQIMAWAQNVLSDIL